MDDGLRGYMASFGMDPGAYTGDGIGARRAIQLFMRETAESRGFDFSDLNDDQLSDDYHYFLFPNVTFNLAPHNFMLFRQRPHESDPNRMYFDYQHYALVAKDAAWPERPTHRRFKHGDERYHPVLEQDADNCETQQRGLNSSGFRGMWISDQEIRVRHLHKVIDHYLDPKSKPRTAEE